MNTSPSAPAYLLCCAALAIAGWFGGSVVASRRAQDSPGFTTARPVRAASDDARPDTEPAEPPRPPGDLRAAMEQVLAQRDDADKARALLTAAHTFRAEDFAAALVALRELGSTNGWKTAKLCDGLFCDWVARDLTSASEWLKAQAPSEWSRLENGRHAWLRADPRGYVNWLRGLGDEPFRWVGNDNTLGEIDPEAGLEFAQRKHGPSATRV